MYVYLFSGWREREWRRKRSHRTDVTRPPQKATWTQTTDWKWGCDREIRHARRLLISANPISHFNNSPPGLGGRWLAAQAARCDLWKSACCAAWREITVGEPQDSISLQEQAKKDWVERDVTFFRVSEPQSARQIGKHVQKQNKDKV